MSGYLFVMPSDYNLLSGKVDGTLTPPDGPDSWPKKNSKRQWLVFYRITMMSLVGGGVIDGRGQKWWDLPCKPHKVLPTSFFLRCLQFRC